jgi:hypothetical protein
MDRLVAVLERPREEVERWIRGDGDTPEDVFRTAVEVILLYTAKHGQP